MFSISDLVVVLKVRGMDYGHKFWGSSGLFYWFWDEEFVWQKGVYGSGWFWLWFVNLMRKEIGLRWFANLVG